MSDLETAVRYVLLAAAACFVLGLRLMNSPATARRGNTLSAAAMAVAIAATAVLLAERGDITATGWLVLLSATVVGSGAGLYLARTVEMTAMPQLVSLFNAVGGGAAALLAIVEVLQHAHPEDLGARTTVPGGIDILVGAITFSGSLIAAGKLQGLIPGKPIVLPGTRALNGALAVIFAGSGVWLVVDPGSIAALTLLTLAGLAFGVTMVLPIGGADMPVVISLLNAFTGTAVGMAGFVLNEPALIIAGALVGASGTILTKLMADAMNRSIPAIIVGGFGTGDDGAAQDTDGDVQVRPVSVDDVAIQLAYAGKVVIVPGYGLAAAQAQHELGDLADLLGVGRGTMSRQVTRLERLGLLARTPDPHDSRSQPLALTPEGERRLAHARAGRQEYMRRSLDAWRDEELTQLADLLGRLNDDLVRHTDRPAGPG